MALIRNIRECLEIYLEYGKNGKFILGRLICVVFTDGIGASIQPRYLEFVDSKSTDLIQSFTIQSRKENVMSSVKF